MQPPHKGLWPAGDSAIARLFRSYDWAATPLGPLSSWPQSLRTTVDIMLNAPVNAMLFWGAQAILLYNDCFAQFIGDRHPGVFAQPVLQAFPEVAAFHQNVIARVMRGETLFYRDEPLSFSVAGTRRCIWADMTYSPVLDESNRPVAVLDIWVDTTERVRARERLVELAAENARTLAALRAREEELKLLNATLNTRMEQTARERDRLWELADDPFMISDKRGVWLAASPAWTRILGWEEDELVGRTSEWMEHPDDQLLTRREFARIAAGGAPSRFVNRFRTQDGSYRWFAWTGVADAELIYCVARDVTADKAKEQELAQAHTALRQSQKMEAIGQLTGGLAHDFNNLLNGITGSLQLMQRRLERGHAEDLSRYIDIAMFSAKRAAVLTHRLLAFARRQTLSPRIVDVNALVDDMSELIQRTIGPAISLCTQADPHLWAALCDANQLENALLNLAINARDAMPQGGELRIETCNLVLDEASRSRLVGLADAEPGDYVCISVSDNGVGMPADVASRAFEPFFTTKPLGLGTGLGLSMVYGFVRQSEGYIGLCSQEGKGTTITLYLPRHAGHASLPADDQAIEAPHASGETVLVVDDEPAVRTLVCERLRELGYRVLEAQDGPSAMRVLGTGAPIDLLITDVGLPGGMNGRQLADAALARQPALKVLFITGYAAHAVTGSQVLARGMHVLTKPFDLDALAVHVRALLEEGG